MGLLQDSERLYRAMEQEAGAPGPGTGASGYRAAVRACAKAMRILRERTGRGALIGPEEELLFFKQIKPRFYSRYIYCVQVYNYLVQRPAGKEACLADIRARLDELEAFAERNRAFYAYCRSGMSDMDRLYFSRSGPAAPPGLEDFEEDRLYATGYDYKLARLLAGEQSQAFLERELARLSAEGADPESLLPFRRANWTGSLTDAVELIYALKASGAVNNGNIGIAELAALWEYVFNTDLKAYYHKFSEITRRKGEPTVFLEKMRGALIRWVDDKLG